MENKLKEAVSRGKEGDKQSLAEIYNETKDMVYFTILKLVKNENDAQDLVQDVYIKAFQKLGELKEDNAFLKWLKIIAVNLSKNYLKKSKPLLFRTEEEQETKLSGIPEIKEDFLPAEYADQKEKCRLIMEIVDSLPSLQRTAVMLYYFNELSIGEVAEMMETNEGTTKSRLNYARKQIKDRVEEHEKKGTKLYGVAAVPFLTKVLYNVSKEYSIPAEVSGSILEASLKAVETGISNTAAGAESAVTAVKAAKGGTTAFMGKSLGASMVTKIIAGVVSVGLVAGGGIGISKITKSTSSTPAQSISNSKKESSHAVIENMAWEKLLGKSKEKVTALLGQPDKEDAHNLYYKNNDSKQTALEIYLDEENTAVMVTCKADEYTVQGIKKGDKLPQVKEKFKNIAGAILDRENVNCGELSAIFYTIDHYSYQVLYDKDEKVDQMSLSLIKSEEFTDEPAKKAEPSANVTKEASQINGSNTQAKGAGVKDNGKAEQAAPGNETSNNLNKAKEDIKIEVKDLLFADKQIIIKTLRKPITDGLGNTGGELIYDGINFLRDFSNKELEFSTHQQNYSITLSSGKYSAYGISPGMTKQQLINNPKQYPVAAEKDGTYELEFPGNGTTVKLFIDFSMGANTASQVTMQAFVEW